MKASKFVKEFGIEKAKLLLSTHGKTIAELKGEYTAKQLKEYQGYIVSGDLMSFVELKRLVESHELIEQYNGLFEAKELIRVSPKLTSELRELAVAIEDMESCK